MAPIVTMTGPKTPHGKEVVGPDVMQNIKVFVRCRPLKASEKKNVIEVLSDRKEIRINESKNSNERYNSKTFTFDNTFGVDTDQLQVYQAVVEPLIEQVVMGYNCTVFAYGQTGTGKTYTMEGERSNGDDLCSWSDDPIAGIIPRALHQLFETLQTGESEHTVRVSFLELYNEELYDLLSPIDDTTKLKIFEDATRKGSVIVGGLEEITVQTKSEIYEILRRGSAKRQTAATLLNACSSRSHTIFSVTVHIKESAIDGEDLVKIGKMNLVDLAGSENIGRSGAIDKRAREAGNINQSLLTLGRVITSLVDRTPHIPYRESKLTRLLQESLGGRTKTSIIATISPNIADADDTLSTLEYAQRAKKITNKPEINQKMSKKTLLREYTAEIERLRRDLAASREKNGIYIDEDNYKQMEQQIKDQTHDITEKTEQIQALVEEMTKIQELFELTKQDLESKAQKLEDTSECLKKTSNKLSETQNDLMVTRIDRNEQKYLVGIHENSEKLLTSQAKELLSVAEVTTNDIEKLHQKVNRVKTVETHNWTKTMEFKEKFDKEMNLLEDLVSITISSYNDSLEEMQSSIHQMITSNASIASESNNKLTLLSNSMTEHFSRMSSLLMKDQIVLEQSMILKENSDKVNHTFEKAFVDIWTKVEETKTCIQEEIENVNQTVAQQREQFEELVMKQNSHIKGVSKRTVDSFKALKTDLKTAFEKQNLSSLKQLIESFNALKAESEREEDRRLEELLNRQKTSRLESQKFCSDLKNFYEDLVSNEKTCLTNFDQKVEGFVSETEFEQKVGLKYNQSVDNMNTENTQQLMDGINEIRSKNTCLPKQTFELIVEQKEDLTQQMIESIKLSEDSIKKCDKQLKAKQTALKELEETVTQGLELQKSLTSDLAANIDSMTECVSTKTSEMISNSQAMERSQVREIENRFKSFEAFVKNDLNQDIPTGTTPQKMTYPFPTDLVQTSPHERILQRYRQNSVNSAINTPLPEEYESEFLSDSNSSKSSLRSLSPNDENVKPLTDYQKRRKAGLHSKPKSNSSQKLDQLNVSDNKTSKQTPKPLTVNRIN